MIICSFDVRGLGGWKGIKVEVLVIPKTNVKEVNEKYYTRWWRGDEVRWLSVSSVGRSSGILLLWDKKKGSLVHIFGELGGLGLCLGSDRRRKCV